MCPTLLPKYAAKLRDLSPADILADEPPGCLGIDAVGPVKIYYAPFDYFNPSARIVLVGITPGREQMNNALLEAMRQLASGAPEDTVAKRAKETGSFSGPLRGHLIDMLNHFRVPELLQIRCCSELFASRSEIVQYSSVLRYPVFIKGENYNGSPDMTRHPLLSRYMMDFFAVEARLLPTALFVPLGGKVEAALSFLVDQGVLARRRVLQGLEHPSGANIERIKYLMGRKAREDLSRQTNADRIDRNRLALTRQIECLLAESR